MALYLSEADVNGIFDMQLALDSVEDLPTVQRAAKHALAERVSRAQSNPRNRSYGLGRLPYVRGGTEEQSHPEEQHAVHALRYGAWFRGLEMCLREPGRGRCCTPDSDRSRRTAASAARRETTFAAGAGGWR